MQQKTTLKKLIHISITTFLSIVALSACIEEDSAISISGLNYTGRYISDFTVNGYSGGNIFTTGGGGSFVCCISVPRRWHKGLKVDVRWADDERNPASYKQRTVEIPEYGPEDLGHIAVHFYKDDSVKVLVTNNTIRHPNYPYPKPK